MALIKKKKEDEASPASDLVMAHAVKKRARMKPEPKGLAEGGPVDEATSVRPDKGFGKIIMTGQAHGGDIADRALSKRCYSEGGKIANEDSGESTDEDSMAKADPNEFDDLALRDDLSADLKPDGHGSDLNQDDFVEKILRKRAKGMPGTLKPGL